MLCNIQFDFFILKIDAHGDAAAFDKDKNGEEQQGNKYGKNYQQRKCRMGCESGLKYCCNDIFHNVLLLSSFCTVRITWEGGKSSYAGVGMKLG